MNIEGMDEEQLKAMQTAQPKTGLKAGKSPPILPAEFSDPDQTKLTIRIPPEGTDKADFHL